jgi:phthalate 4,5-cis-dihydrodiol dehydrogenase
VMHDKQPVHTGEWARATTEGCLAILESARTQADYHPKFQVGTQRSSPFQAALEV